MNYNKLLNENKIVNGIKGFQGKYRILSNFAIHNPIGIPLPWGSSNAVMYYGNNVEALFQSAKSLVPSQIKIISSSDPSSAKRLGRRCNLRTDWELIKEDVMYYLLKTKYQNVKEFKDLLDSIPKDKVIVEFNTWNDKEWGVCSKTFIGKNKLGNLLMKLRSEQWK